MLCLQPSDGNFVRCDTAQTHLHFELVWNRLYTVSRDTKSEDVITQLLVPKKEMVFEAAHHNPMAGHMGKHWTG